MGDETAAQRPYSRQGRKPERRATKQKIAQKSGINRRHLIGIFASHSRHEPLACFASKLTDLGQSFLVLVVLLLQVRLPRHVGISSLLVDLLLQLQLQL